MPLQGILNTARSLSYYMRKQEVTANNLANSRSDAFKADRIRAERVSGAVFPVPVQDLDLQQGTFRETARPLDLSLDGGGFFVVDTPQGERLTRGGSFRLDSVGHLTDSQGHRVMGADGPLLLQGGTVEVHGDGSIVVDGSNAGRLRIVDVADPTQLRKEGFGRFTTTAVPAAVDPNVTRVRQGAVEEANLDPLLSMVDLVTIQRAFTANMDALRAMDSVLGAVSNEVGKA
ncbi:MAG: flagellar hook basal-body protein [Candidatus Eisenbacteria bacterium]|nr:flagellar hook basal-body protein [Candidatus Eisenbacteria bacterium]